MKEYNISAKRYKADMRKIMSMIRDLNTGNDGDPIDYNLDNRTRKFVGRINEIPECESQEGEAAEVPTLNRQPEPEKENVILEQYSSWELSSEEYEEINEAANVISGKVDKYMPIVGKILAGIVHETAYQEICKICKKRHF